ncbi:hypothetical protein ACFE04_030633 [Oxalis oulophora]
MSQSKNSRPRVLKDVNCYGVMETLPRELFWKILLYLPHNSLVRFGYTSKSCYALIFSHEFNQFCLKSGSQDQSLIYTNQALVKMYEKDGSKSSRYEGLLVQILFKGYLMVGASNGLICVAPLRRITAIFNTKDIIEFVIWNPLTRCYRELQKHEDYEKLMSKGRQLQVKYTYGFGFDSSSSDYKLVVGSYPITKPCDGKTNLTMTTNILSMRNIKSWRKCCKTSFFKISEVSTLLNGALHWEISRKGNKKSVLVLDLAKENFQDLKLPPSCEAGPCDALYKLGVLKGCLSICCDQFEPDHQYPYSLSIDIWTMKEYGVKESWTKIFSISDKYASNYYRLPILSFSQREDNIIEICNECSLRKYSLEDETCNVVKLDMPMRRFPESCTRLDNKIQSSRP